MCSHGWNTPELFVVQIQPEILVWAFKVDTPNLVGSLVLATETADIVAGSKKTDRGQLEASASAPSKDEAEKASETTTLVSSREGQPAPEDEPATKKFKLSPQKKIALKAETEEVLEESSFIEPTRALRQPSKRRGCGAVIEIDQTSSEEMEKSRDDTTHKSVIEHVEFV